jgi:hypothetical protein
MGGGSAVNYMSVTAFCGVNSRVLGGGYDVDQKGADHIDGTSDDLNSGFKYLPLRSLPTNADGTLCIPNGTGNSADCVGWTVRIHAESASSQVVPFDVYAVCAMPAPAPITTAAAQADPTWRTR